MRIWSLFFSKTSDTIVAAPPRVMIKRALCPGKTPSRILSPALNAVPIHLMGLSPLGTDYGSGCSSPTISPKTYSHSTTGFKVSRSCNVFHVLVSVKCILHTNKLTQEFARKESRYAGSWLKNEAWRP